MLRPCLVVGLALLSACASNSPNARSGGGWSELRTADILLRTDLSPRRAREVVTSMQELHDAFRGRVLGCALDGEDGAPFEVTLLGDDREFTAIYGAAVGGRFVADERWADVHRRVVLRPNVNVTARQLFQHELTHALVERCYPGAPRWLDEGLASFLETATIYRRELRVGVPRYIMISDTTTHAGIELGVIVTGVPIGSYVPPSRLVSLPPGAFFGGTDDSSEAAGIARHAHYATAWAMVHFFQIGGDRDVRRAFDRYLRDLRHGSTSDAAWDRNFRRFDADAVIGAYVRQPTYDYLAFPFEPEDAGAPVVRPMSESEAHLELAGLWAEEDDETHLRSVERHTNAALADPSTRARAAVMHAEATDRRGLHAQALAEIARALAEDPDDPDLLRVQLVDLCARIDSGVTAVPSTLAADAAHLERVARTGRETIAAARAYLLAGDRVRARSLTDAAIAADGDTVSVLVAHVETLVRLGDASDALPFLDRAIARVSHAPTLLAELVRLRARIVASTAR